MEEQTFVSEVIKRVGNPNLFPASEDYAELARELIARRISPKHKWLTQVEYPRISAVYALIVRGKIRYIGKSVNVLSRVRGHKVYRHFDRIGFIPVPEDVLPLVEFRLIRNLKPPGNSIHIQERTSWGSAKVDDMALVLNTTPAIIYEVVEAAGIRPSGLNIDVREVIWHYSRMGDRLKIALADAIRRPMGVVPESAEGLLTQEEIDAAEERRIEGRAPDAHANWKLPYSRRGSLT